MRWEGGKRRGLRFYYHYYLAGGSIFASPQIARFRGHLARRNLATFRAITYKSGRHPTLLWAGTRRTQDLWPDMFGGYVRRKK